MSALRHLGLLLCTSLSLLALGACEDDPEPEAPAPAAPAAATRVEVHEWGLVAHHYSEHETGVASVVSGGARYAHAPILGHGAGTGYGGKPVLYIHAEGGEARLSVRVRAPGRAIVEHLPATDQRDRSVVEWRSLVAAGESCPTTARLTPDDPRCRTADDYCEALENPSFDTDDASCLTTADGARENHLFYRAELSVSGLPLVVTRPDPEGPGWEARNAGQTPIAGKLVMVWRSGGNAPPKVEIVDPPAPGQKIALPIDGPRLARLDCEAALAAMLSQRGLTSAESAAFLSAWATSIFGYVEHPGEPSPGGDPPAALRQTPIALYYLAPDDALARALPLEVTPAPDRVVRAVLVKVDLHDPPVGTIGLGLRGPGSGGPVENAGTIGIGALPPGTIIGHPEGGSGPIEAARQPAE